MKVKCVVDDCVRLTFGKIYDAEIVEFRDKEWYSLVDDDEDEAYLYPMKDFELVKD